MSIVIHCFAPSPPVGPKPQAQDVTFARSAGRRGADSDGCTEVLRRGTAQDFAKRPSPEVPCRRASMTRVKVRRAPCRHTVQTHVEGCTRHSRHCQVLHVAGDTRTSQTIIRHAAADHSTAMLTTSQCQHGRVYVDPVRSIGSRPIQNVLAGTTDRNSVSGIADASVCRFLSGRSPGHAKASARLAARQTS